MNNLKTEIGVAIIMVGMFLLSSCGEKKEKQLPQAFENQEIQKEESLSTEKEFIEVDISALNSLRKGSVVELKKKEEEKIYRLEIRRVQETIPGITSISANIEDKDTGLATLLLRERKLSGVLNVYRENRKYKVGYDSTVGAHYIQELLREEMDKIEGGAPLIPGRDIP